MEKETKKGQTNFCPVCEKRVEENENKKSIKKADTYTIDPNPFNLSHSVGISASSYYAEGVRDVIRI